MMLELHQLQMLSRYIHKVDTLRLREPLLSLFAPRFRRVRLLLLDSSPDTKPVFLDNGKLTMEINLAEPVEPFCKNRPNICFGWRSRSQPNDSRSTGRRKSDQITEVLPECGRFRWRTVVPPNRACWTRNWTPSPAPPSPLKIVTHRCQ